MGAAGKPDRDDERTDDDDLRGNSGGRVQGSAPNKHLADAENEQPVNTRASTTSNRRGLHRHLRHRVASNGPLTDGGLGTVGHGAQIERPPRRRRHPTAASCPFGALQN